MSVALALLACAALADVRYLDVSLELETDVLDARFVDVDGDGKSALLVAVASRDGRRELRAYALGERGIARIPYCVVPVLDDVLAYAVADVRSEPGRELVFLTKSGAWSYSLRVEGYRGNIRRLMECELLYDVPDPDGLAYWGYVFDRGGRGDWLLLPGFSSLLVVGPVDGAPVDAARASGYQLLAELAHGGRSGFGFGSYSAGDGAQGSSISVGGGGISFTATGGSDELFVVADAGERSRFLEVQRSVRAPARVDVDRDGDLDLLLWDGKELRVVLAGPLGLAIDDVRVEPLPAYLVREDVDPALSLADLDGDGDPDLVATLEEGGDGFENSQVSLFLLLNDGAHLFPAEPDQILKFEAAEHRFEVADVDGDGRPDLVVRKFELPSVMATMTGLEFTLTHLLFLGQPGGGRPFDRRSVLKHTQTFDESTVQSAIANRHMTMDCDGDGIADLVEVDVDGRIAIRRLARRKGFLGGTTWTLEDEPWKRFDVQGSIASLSVRDLNGDGLADIVSRSRRLLSVLLSQASEARRR